jgi:hypothetical protein
MVGEAPNLPQRLPISQFIVIASNNENVGCLWRRLRAYSPRLNGIDSINLYKYSPRFLLTPAQLFASLFKDVEDPSSSELSPSTATLELGNPCRLFLCSG